MKRYALWILVLSIGISALLGCAALLSSHFGETQGKVLLSTLVIAQASLLAMVCAVSVERAAGAGLARLGILLAVATVPALLSAIWGEVEGKTFWRMTGTLEIAAIAGAHASLVLVASLRADRRWMRGATLLVAGALAALVLALLWDVIDEQGKDEIWRPLGVLAILALAGTILVWVFHRMDRGAFATGVAAAAGSPRLRHCVACGGDRIEASATGVRCYGCGAHFRAELDATPGAG